MAKEIDRVQAALLWDRMGVSVDNVRLAPRQHQGNVVFCGYADILIWIFAGDEAVPLIQLCGNSIKLIGNNLHFDPKSERGQGDHQNQYFAHWFPTTGAARAVLARKLAELPEIQEMLAQAKQQLIEATPRRQRDWGVTSQGRRKPMRTFILATLIGVLLGLSGPAGAGDFYQYTNSDGVIAFTDNRNRIPEAFASEAVERTFAELRQTTGTQITPHNTRGPVLVPAGVADLPVSRTRLNDCTGHVTVTSVRRQVGDYNRRFIVATDECGRTISVTPHYPNVQINR